MHAQERRNVQKWTDSQSERWPAQKPPSTDPLSTAHTRPGEGGQRGYKWQTLIRQFHPSIAKAAVAPPLRPHGPGEATDDDAARQWQRVVTAQGSNPNQT